MVANAVESAADENDKDKAGQDDFDTFEDNYAEVEDDFETFEDEYAEVEDDNEEDGHPGSCSTISVMGQVNGGLAEYLDDETATGTGRVQGG